MKTCLLYIVLLSWLFGFMDWQTVHLTRWVDRSWLDWMHAHETQYAAITRPLETILCTPCMAFKPLTHYWSMKVQASQEEQDAIIHAPEPDARGFYHLPKRGESWTFVPWASWFGYWFAPSLLWFYLLHKLVGRMRN